MTTKPDWEAIEREYRAGQLSVREIARTQGVSDTAIRKRARKYGWTRNLAEQVRSGVRDELVRGEGCTADTQEAVQAGIQRGAEVIRSHRTDIASARETVRDLLAELKGETADIEELIRLATGGEKPDKRLLHALSLPQRAQTAQQLSGALEKLVRLERKAFNLDDEDAGDDDYVPIEDRLKSYTHDRAIDAADNVERMKRTA